MCGIAGIYSFGVARPGLAGRIHRMTDSLRHRGPDDEGYVLINTRGRQLRLGAGDDTVDEARATSTCVDQLDDDAFDLALGHRRFAIIDLSPGGHQPFVSPDRQICGVFNGLIYNYREVRTELRARGIAFQTDSDTEVLWQAYACWGSRCFEKLNGTWAVAIYDFGRKELLLCRDRLGKRPLYFHRNGPTFSFASEIKPLLREMETPLRVNDAAVFRFLAGGLRDIDSSTFYHGIESLPAGTVVRVSAEGDLVFTRFWDLPQSRLRPSSTSEAAEELRTLLEDAVRIRLRADVPLGVELSGGLDSSSIAGLASTLHPGSLSCYTVEFRQPEWNEEPFARQVAERFGFDYHRVQSPDRWFWSDAERIVELHEEPFHAPNLHTQQAVWRLMHDAGIKVILYGAGGDELFAGYRKEYFYRYLEQLLKRGRLLRFLNNFSRFSELSPAELVAKAVHGLRGSAGPDAVLSQAIPPWLACTSAPTPTASSLEAQLHLNMTQLKMPYWLRSNDKNSLAIPVEVRAPLLDYRIVEFAFRLPLDYLIRDGWLKWILRRAMHDLLPPEITWRRRKMGYPFPLRDWLRASLPIVRTTLAQSDNPYFDKRIVAENLEPWILHQPDLVWRILILELWHRRFVRDGRILDGSTQRGFVAPVSVLA